MANSIKITSNNLKDTQKIAEILADFYIENNGGLICLYGDIGSGKTALTRFIAKRTGVVEKVTSPSFVILNEYHSGKIPLYHFDFYRLEKEGVSSMIDEIETYCEQPDTLTIVEWAEFSDNRLPPKRLNLNIKYIDEDTRALELTCEEAALIKALKERFKNYEYTGV
ncbi:MAG: tRNA (adenosine(37)-N6)-threonylcarbamoyltransferase complex ATPase subunit type 1 TsaE [Candidatus Gastranaerophilales bacterium]|nr:tRNA (adenosine(37)-N6)-threonylcarbamoyltransferase complex ATPase subunit type 1 TsaE [Candidatus Gastranaerophilales bacterium]